MLAHLRTFWRVNNRAAQPISGEVYVWLAEGMTLDDSVILARTTLQAPRLGRLPPLRRRPVPPRRREMVQRPYPAMPDDFSYDVFLSHNSRDKGSLRPLVKRLQDGGLRIFWDESELPGGAEFVEEIDRALRRCAAAAVCIGPDGAGPFQSEEARYLLVRALRERESFRIIPILLPGSRPEDMEFFLQTRTRVESGKLLDDDRELARFVEMVRRTKPSEVESPVLRPSPPRVGRRETLLPVLCDRRDQLDELKNALGSRSSRDGVRPLAFLLPGEDQQGHDHFVDALRFDHLPRLLKVPAEGPPLLVSRPDLPDWRGDRDRFARELTSALARDLKLSDGSSDRDLLKTFDGHPAVLVIMNFFPAVSWQKDAGRSISECLNFWDRLVPTSPLIILFCFRCRCVPSGWLERLLAWKGFPRRLRRMSDLERLQEYIDDALAANFDRVKPVPLRPLEDVKLDDVRKWAQSSQVREFCRAAEAELDQRVRKLFEANRTEAMDMERLVTELKSLLSRCDS